jgi:hypothetical protein
MLLIPPGGSVRIKVEMTLEHRKFNFILEGRNASLGIWTDPSNPRDRPANFMVSTVPSCGGVRGTDFDVFYDGRQACYQCYDGQIWVAALGTPNDTHIVNPGQTAVIAEDGSIWILNGFLEERISRAGANEPSWVTRPATSEVDATGVRQDAVGSPTTSQSPFLENQPQTTPVGGL